MTEARIRYFSSLTFDQFYELTAKDFLVSEIEELISETPLRDEEKRLTVAFYIKCKTNQEVADDFSMSVDTVKRKKRELHEAMLNTIIKMFFQYAER